LQAQDPATHLWKTQDPRKPVDNETLLNLLGLKVDTT